MRATMVLILVYFDDRNALVPRPDSSLNHEKSKYSYRSLVLSRSFQVYDFTHSTAIAYDLLYTQAGVQFCGLERYGQ